MVLQALQRTSDARQEFNRSVQLQPQQTESYLQLGLIELEMGNLKEAREEFDRVLKRDPRHARALTGLGRVKFEEKDYAGAASLLTNAIAIAPRLREAHYYLGLTDARLGRKEESEKELQIASELEHAEAEQQRNHLKIVDSDQLRVPAAPQSQ
jgi:tetratricopeptide (TPR) repeat protein